VLYYPKIPGSRDAPPGRCVAFEKYDGTNLHWDWDREFGWHSFGTRRDEFDLSEAGVARFTASHSHLHQCVGVFHSTLAGGLESVFTAHKSFSEFAGFRVFTEFFGQNSFAGLHQSDDPKRLVIFDVSAKLLGMLGPERFVADFGHLPIARVVYRGKLTGQFAEDVRIGKYGVAEGVVCKRGSGGPDLWMAKIKTYAYLEKLKRAFGERWEDYWE
jgi:RNA ligase